MTKLSVEAELRIRAQQGQRALQQLAGRLQGLQSALGSTQTAAGSLARSFAGLAAGYVGVNALVGGMRALTTSAVQYQTELEGTSIGLASVVSAVEQIPFAEAQRQSESLFRQIQDDAIQSTATSAQLFGIFQSIYGPLRNAGLQTADIRQTMLDTVSAASALGVDFEQASRDIQAMARGAAGADVRLFSMLRSTGAIAEDAEAFNRLSQPERIDMMRSALGRFSSAADAYGRSFAGVTSTFTDVAQNLTSAFFGPTFREFSSFLGRVNEQLIANREGLRSSIGEAGERVAAVLGGLFRRIESGLVYVIENFDPLMAKATQFANKLREVVPDLLKAAAAFMAIQAGIAGFGRLLGIASTIVSAAGGLAELGLLGGAGAGTAGAAAAGAGTAGGAAGAGGLASVTAALSAAAAPAALILAAIASVLLHVGSVVLVVYERIDAFRQMLSDLSPVFEAIGADFTAIISDLFQVLRPYMQLLGTLILTVLVPAFLLFITILRVLLSTLRWVMEQLRTFADMIRTNITEPFRDSILEVGGLITSILGGAVGAVRSAQSAQAGAAAPAVDFEAEARRTRAQYGLSTFGYTDPESAPTRTPNDRRPVQHNDFRGSRISVNQEFRQADPDRVALQMIEDINRQAEARIQSGFVPALTR